MSVSRLPTFQQLDRYGYDAGTVLEAHIRELEMALGWMIRDSDYTKQRRNLKAALRRADKRWEEYFGPET